MKSYQKNILELLCKKELLLSKLYKIFAAKFPEYGSFWLGLSKDEDNHAKWIKDLYHSEKKKLVVFSEGKTKTYTINSFNERIEKIIRRAENGEIDLKMAGAYALDFENSLIEKNVFNSFEVIHESVKGIMAKIDDETIRHFKEVQDMVSNFSLQSKNSNVRI